MTDRIMAHRHIKRPVKKQRKTWLFGKNEVYIEYVEDTWPMIDGCFCGLCKGTSHILNEDDYWKHQIFCCARWGE